MRLDSTQTLHKAMSFDSLATVTPSPDIPTKIYSEEESIRNIGNIGKLQGRKPSGSNLAPASKKSLFFDRAAYHLAVPFPLSATDNDFLAINAQIRKCGSGSLQFDDFIFYLDRFSFVSEENRAHVFQYILGNWILEIRPEESKLTAFKKMLEKETFGLIPQEKQLFVLQGFIRFICQVRLFDNRRGYTDPNRNAEEYQAFRAIITAQSEFAKTNSNIEKNIPELLIAEMKEVGRDFLWETLQKAVLDTAKNINKLKDNPVFSKEQIQAAWNELEIMIGEFDKKKHLFSKSRSDKSQKKEFKKEISDLNPYPCPSRLTQMRQMLKPRAKVG
jgi:hypothetical protein